MATTNYSWNLPTVGGSEDTWGTSLNANWTALDTLLGGVTQSEFALLSGQTSLVPAGVILLWSGSIASIPSGWNLCDGTNGTPDLRNRFVVAAGDTYAVGDTGGDDSVTLTSSQMPSHTHTFSATTGSAGNHDHALLGGTGSVADFFGGSGENYGVGIGSASASNRTDDAGAHTHSVSGTTASTGGGDSHENRPPYYALAYIMKA
jgi:microcystin-dependent protein